MKKKKIFVRIPPVADCGVGYYRQILPLETAKKKGKIDYRCKTFTWGKKGDESGKPTPNPTIKELSDNTEWADIVYYARNDVPQYLAEAGGLRDYFFAKTGIHKLMILDIDDYVQATRPYNPGYRSFYPNSACNIWNIKSFGIYDGITVSTDYLKKIYSNYTNPDKIFVCPNSLDFKERDKILKDDFKKSSLYQKKSGEIRIGWTGSAAHWENLKHIEPVILDILRKYPQTTFYYTGLFGDLFQDKDLYEQKRIVNVKWAGLKDWARFNKEVNFDIALAPLMDNDFNRAKSNLRILEYASAKYPVICSPILPYKTFTSKEVIFAMEKEEWFKAIEELIKSPNLCVKMSEALYKFAKMRYNISKNYNLWLKAFDYFRKLAKISK